MSFRAGALIAVAGSVALLLPGCGGGTGSPNGPGTTGTLRTISVSPSGIGIEAATRFMFTADVTNASGSSYAWNFGDGGSAQALAASHVYSRAGTYTATFTMTTPSGRSERSVVVSVASLVGLWQGTVTGHSRYPANRPIPITAFQLRLHQPPPAGSTGRLSATWTDSAGCVDSARVHGWVADPRIIRFGVEQLACNDGDFYLQGTADEQIRVITGECMTQGGPNCRFQMVRQ